MELQLTRTAPNTAITRPAFGLAAYGESVNPPGGDFYDVIHSADGSRLLVVADAMGKGKAAAFFASRLRSLLRTFAGSTSGPAALLQRINRLMYEDLSRTNLFITAQLARLEPGGELTVANAGHCPLLLSDGSGQVRAIAPEGIPLGILPRAEYLEEKTMLSTRACALLYTDGVTESAAPSGELFGQERLEGWLSRTGDSLRPASGLQEDLLAQLRAFRAGRPAADDLTFVILAGESCQAGVARPRSARLTRMPSRENAAWAGTE